MLLEHRHGKWKMLLDHPLDECLMGALLLPIVGDCVFQRLASLLHNDFSHLDGFVVDIVKSEKIFVC